MRIYYRMQLNFVLRTGVSLRSIARDREVRLHVDGRAAFRRVEKLIAQSRVSIVIQMFIWKDDATGRKVAQWLIDAADRGVVVEIMKEAVGDFFELYNDFLGTKDSPNPLWQRFWNHSRIRISHATHYDHAKVYVIDGHTLLLTGMNIADEYRYEWHDCMVELHGSRFVERFLTRSVQDNQHTQIRIVTNTEETKEIRSTFFHLLAEAKEHVILEHAYLSDPDVIAQLVALSKRGVRLTIIIPLKKQLHSHANSLAIGVLMTEGNLSNIRVFVYPGFCHSKILLVDSSIAFLGSANLYRGSLDDMGEVNVLIRGRIRALWALKEMLRKDILMSTSLSSPPGFLWISRWMSWLGL